MSTYSGSQPSMPAAPAGVAVLVATYEPGRALLDLVEPLLASGVAAVIVVDDASSASREWVLDRLALEPAVHLLRHRVHRGRGAALKTGMRYFLDHLRHYAGLVTVSANGQYAAEDVLRVARALHRSPKLAIIAARELAGDPRRNAASTGVANGLLRLLFRAVTGIEVSDVQSELRALPTALLPRLATVPGNRFDYELAALLHIVRSGYPLAEHAVAARVEARSADPEFRPVGDSISLLRALVKCDPVASYSAETQADQIPAESETAARARRPQARQPR